MRRAHDSKWLQYEGGEVYGIALGSDFVAEHEWGIAGIWKKLGARPELDGIDRRTMTQHPNQLRFVKGKTWDAIFMSGLEDFYRQPDQIVKENSYRDEDKLLCLWDDSTFGIAAYTELDRKKLKVLWEAFEKKDIATWTNIGVFHIGTGLMFVMPSKVKDSDKKTLLEHDLDIKRLKAADKATGIEKWLEDKGKKHFALSPRWANEIKSTRDGELKTSYEVIYWLNPYDQHKYNSGWYTVEDLKEWAEEKGRVVKSKEQLDEERKEREEESKRRRR